MIVYNRRKLGLEYNKIDIEKFSDELYDYILNYKREIDLMSPESRKQGITDIYERFRLILNENLADIRRALEKLEERINKLEN